MVHHCSNWIWIDDSIENGSNTARYIRTLDGLKSTIVYSSELTFANLKGQVYYPIKYQILLISFVLLARDHFTNRESFLFFIILEI